MKNNIAVILLAGSNMQNICFWPSFDRTVPGVNFDLILSHLNHKHLPDREFNQYGLTYIENKIDSNGNDVPCKAFGAYRHFFSKYSGLYEYFVFISDDVVIKRNNWLKHIINMLGIHEKCGFGGSQVFNGNKRYPHPSHVRAPFWFAKTEALSSIKWEFNDDHDGEMKIGDQLTSAGYFGVQVGNKINLAYDALETDHITVLLEQRLFPDKHPYGLHDPFEGWGLWEHNLGHDSIPYIDIESPHVGKQNSLMDIEPFNGLIYHPSLEIAKNCIKVYERLPDTFLIAST